MHLFSLHASHASLAIESGIRSAAAAAALLDLQSLLNSLCTIFRLNYSNAKLERTRTDVRLPLLFAAEAERQASHARWTGVWMQVSRERERKDGGTRVLLNLLLTL